jgi:hypothetical protein
MIFSITDPVSMPVNLLDNVNVKEALHYQWGLRDMETGSVILNIILAVG